MDTKTCSMCNKEKHINSFCKRNSEYKDFKIKRRVKGYYDSKDKISIQQKIYYERIEINYYRNKMITKEKKHRL